MGFTLSPIVPNLYMDEVESKTLSSFKGTASSHWYRYVDDTGVTIKIQEVELFTVHISVSVH